MKTAGASPQLVPLLSLLLLVLFVLSLGLGTDSFSLWQGFRDWLLQRDSVAAVILTDIRLPRALIALVAGASLGLCGAAMQGLLRNPLASPGLIGSASGAALAAVAVLYYGGAALAGTLAAPLGADPVVLDVLQSAVLPLSGMLGALAATALVYLLAGSGASVATLILAGIAINALATACMSLLLNLAPSPYAVRELILWTLGDITDRSMRDFWLMLPTSLLGWFLLIGVAHKLDLLTLGERTAISMGVNIAKLRWQVFIAVSFAVGAAVSTTGMIGFVGLVVPHLLRPLVGYEPGRLLRASALGGSAMVLAADIGVRLIPTNTSIKLGVLTALVGAPFFLHLIIRSRREFR